MVVRTLALASRLASTGDLARAWAHYGVDPDLTEQFTQLLPWLGSGALVHPEVQEMTGLKIEVRPARHRLTINPDRVGDLWAEDEGDDDKDEKKNWDDEKEGKKRRRDEDVPEDVPEEGLVSPPPDPSDPSDP